MGVGLSGHAEPWHHAAAALINLVKALQPYTGVHRQMIMAITPVSLFSDDDQVTYV